MPLTAVRLWRSPWFGHSCRLLLHLLRSMTARLYVRGLHSGNLNAYTQVVLGVLSMGARCMVGCPFNRHPPLAS